MVWNALHQYDICVVAFLSATLIHIKKTGEQGLKAKPRREYDVLASNTVLPDSTGTLHLTTHSTMHHSDRSGACYIYIYRYDWAPLTDTCASQSGAGADAVHVPRYQHMARENDLHASNNIEST